MTVAIELRDRLRDEAKQKNRALMPNLAALMDEMRLLDSDVRLVYGKDEATGHEIGQRPVIDESKTFTIPPDYFPCQTVPPLLNMTARKKAR